MARPMKKSGCLLTIAVFGLISTAIALGFALVPHNINYQLYSVVTGEKNFEPVTTNYFVTVHCGSVFHPAQVTAAQPAFQYLAAHPKWLNGTSLSSSVSGYAAQCAQILHSNKDAMLWWSPAGMLIIIPAAYIVLLFLGAALGGGGGGTRGYGWQGANGLFHFRFWR